MFSRQTFLDGEFFSLEGGGGKEWHSPLSLLIPSQKLFLSNSANVRN
jgi:hypothetical protein